MQINNIASESVSFFKVLNDFYVYAGDKTDKFVQEECRSNGMWDIELTKWMIENIKPGWTCLDIGANTFYFTEIMARMVGSSGHVLAFEPITRICDLHKAAQALNNYDGVGKIDIKNIALSNKKDKMFLHIWEENLGGSRIVEEEYSGKHEDFGYYHTEPIYADRLDSVYSGAVDFIKIDVEGHESVVFEGFSDAAKNCPLIVIELGGGQPDNFLLELDNKYCMEFLNGEIATIDKIKEHSVVNVLLKIKQIVK
jgi:FkbM family methyltransferase